MRLRSITFALCISLGCGDDSEDTAASLTGSDSSDGSTDPSDPTNASSSPTSNSSSPTTNSSSPTTDPTDATDSDDSTTGMTGCETGPLPGPIPGCAPTPMAGTGDFGQDCVDRINQFRWECQCLPPLQRWADAEVCTDDQSGNDQQSGAAHGNFGACNEFAQNTCPDWPSEDDVIVGCLQLMWDEGPGEPFEAHGHYINMSNTEYTKVACGRSASGQGVWSNQNFSF